MLSLPSKTGSYCNRSGMGRGIGDSLDVIHGGVLLAYGCAFVDGYVATRSRAPHGPECNTNYITSLCVTVRITSE